VAYAVRALTSSQAGSAVGSACTYPPRCLDGLAALACGCSGTAFLHLLCAECDADSTMVCTCIHTARLGGIRWHLGHIMLQGLAKIWCVGRRSKSCHSWATHGFPPQTCARFPTAPAASSDHHTLPPSEHSVSFVPFTRRREC
jgi:hypothetical protein